MCLTLTALKLYLLKDMHVIRKIQKDVKVNIKESNFETP